MIMLAGVILFKECRGCSSYFYSFSFCLGSTGIFNEMFGGAVSQWRGGDLNLSIIEDYLTGVFFAGYPLASLVREK